MESQNEVRKTSFFDKRITISTVIVFVGMALLVGIGVGSGVDVLRSYVNDRLLAAPSGDLAKKDFSLYWDVYNKLQSTYVDPSKLNADKLFYGSIKGMVESIGDAPTVFYDPTQTTAYQNIQSGSYAGIGAELDYINKSVVVVSPFDGSPAAAAGIEAQDIIVDVDGKSTTNKTLTEVVTAIRGDAGTKVSITILRPRENLKKHVLDVTRANVSAPSMALIGVKDGIATVRISRFTEADLPSWVAKWNTIAADLKQRQDKGEVKSVIIDLRNNPGGFFDAAVILASDFLPKGSVVAYQQERSGAIETFPTTSEPRFGALPVTVLVNGSSASASEIFAGAMKYYKRAKLVGENTYGKGTAQIILPITGGASLHLTISKWLLPDKSWINPDNTIKPDTTVVLDYDLKAKGTDNQMNAAIKSLMP